MLAAESGFTYIIGAPETRELGRQLREGIGRMGRLVRPPPSGMSEDAELAEMRWAIGAAWTLVVIATPVFCRSALGKDLVHLCDGAHPRVITLGKRGHGKVYPWRSNLNLDLPEATNQTSLDELIERLDKEIRDQERAYAGGEARGPVGRPGLFAMLSYARPQGELARSVRDRFTEETISRWDYAEAPRRQVPYRDELAEIIRDARVVVILLSEAWLRSEDCQREARQAAELHKRRLWLRCDDTPFPEDAARADCFEFGPQHRTRTLQQLARAVFPSRRKKHEGA